MTIPNGKFVSSSPKTISTHHVRILIFGLCVLALCFAKGALSASGLSDHEKREKPYALIFGTIWGPDDRPVYGVHVEMRRAAEKKVRWDAYSDHHGEFAFRVPPGKTEYLVRANLKGYKSQDGRQLQAPEDVKVQVENDERVDIGVHLK